MTPEQIAALEKRNAELEAFVRSCAEIAPNTLASIYVAREWYTFTEKLHELGKQAKRLLPNEYVSVDDYLKREGKK